MDVKGTRAGQYVGGGFPLSQMHRRDIDLNIHLLDKKSHFRGKGVHEIDAQLGQILRIQVTDPSGDFEFVLQQSAWNGVVEKSTKEGCDFSITLGSAR